MGLRALLVLMLVAGLFGGGWKAGADHVRAQAAAEQARQVQQARQAEQDLQRTKDEAIHAHQKRDRALRAAADSARAELDGLRGELADSAARLPGATCAAVRERTAALEAVFGECAGRLEELAGQADRHASDALMFEQAWPRVAGADPSPTKGAPHGQQEANP